MGVIKCQDSHQVCSWFSIHLHAKLFLYNGSVQQTPWCRWLDLQYISIKMNTEGFSGITHTLSLNCSNITSCILFMKSLLRLLIGPSLLLSLRSNQGRFGCIFRRHDGGHIWLPASLHSAKSNCLEAAWTPGSLMDWWTDDHLLHLPDWW